ncbi:MAG: hypothetical protein COA78_13920 [Blastopirellula sp.]|nr:MAG: hypothetical protein COA78_13920 [Blastopirellula sp.]
MQENPFQSPETEQSALQEEAKEPEKLSRAKSIYPYTFEASILCLIIAILFFLLVPALLGTKVNNTGLHGLIALAVLLAFISGIVNIIGLVTGSILYQSKQAGLRGILYHAVLLLLPVTILSWLTYQLLTN